MSTLSIIYLSISLPTVEWN